MRKVLVNIEVTPNCPAACSMCPRSLVRDSGFMSLRTMEHIAECVDPEIAWEVDMAGRGEPTIHPRLPELADVMASIGAPTCIVTTGVALTPANAASIAERFDIVRLSVSSTNRATFECVHVGLDHARTWRNIRALAEVAADKTIVHLTGGPRIYEHLPETVETLRELGFRRFRLLTLWNRGGHFETVQHREQRRALMRELDIPPSENEAWTASGKARFLAGTAVNKIRNARFCPIGNASLSISWDGKILGCFQDFGHTSIAGHLADTDLRAHLRERVAQLGRMPVCHGCDAKDVSLFKLL